MKSPRSDYLQPQFIALINGLSLKILILEVEPAGDRPGQVVQAQRQSPKGLEADPLLIGTSDRRYSITDSCAMLQPPRST